MPKPFLRSSRMTGSRISRPAINPVADLPSQGAYNLPQRLVWPATNENQLQRLFSGSITSRYSSQTWKIIKKANRFTGGFKAESIRDKWLMDFKLRQYVALPSRFRFEPKANCKALNAPHKEKKKFERQIVLGSSQPPI